jgi:hypothetical protein
MKNRLAASALEQSLAALRQRGFYYQGTHFACGESSRDFALAAMEIPGAEKISVRARELFLPSPVLFSEPPELRLRSVAVSDYSKSLGGAFQVDSFGNCLWGTAIPRGPFYTLDVHEAVFHRPHFLPKLWRTLLMRYRVLSVRAILPDTSPLAALFPCAGEEGEVWVRWPTELKGEGMHFVLPQVKGYHEPD